MKEPVKTTALLSAPFRPFFIAAALHAMLAILAWLAFLLHGWRPGPLLPDPFLWHGHSLLSGFAGAIIAGFLLTAAASWTGTRTTTPLTLSLLLAFWLVARVAEYLPGTPPLVSLFADGGFWLLTFALLMRVIIASGNWRNLGFGVLPLAFGTVDLAWHLDHAGLVQHVARPAVWAGVDLLVLIMGAMGGRVIPFFTNRRIPSAVIRRPASIAYAANVLLVAVVLANLFFRGEPITAWLMLLAGLALLARLAGWNSLATRHEPMLWILHLGYAWLAIGLLLRAFAQLTFIIPEAAAMHAVTVGALGALGLGMLVRVALGHTGREIVADRLVVVAFAMITLAALARLSMLVEVPRTLALGASAAFWIVAFALYLWRFVPILIRPRPS